VRERDKTDDGRNDGSPVSREAHAGFCEKLRVKCPQLTHHYSRCRRDMKVILRHLSLLES
jgi:hypothetical protein